MTFILTKKFPLSKKCMQIQGFVGHGAYVDSTTTKDYCVSPKGVSVMFWSFCVSDKFTMSEGDNGAGLTACTPADTTQISIAKKVAAVGAKNP